MTVLRNAVLSAGAMIAIVASIFFTAAHWVWFPAAGFAEVFDRSAPTAILVAASVAIAAGITSLCNALTARPLFAWIGKIVSEAFRTLGRFPIFGLCLAFQLVFALNGFGGIRVPFAGMFGDGDPTFVNFLYHLIVPSFVLAVFQVGTYLDYTQRSRSWKALLIGLADLFPAIVSADIVVEALFAWPGIARPFFFSPPESQPRGTFFLAVLIASGLVAIGIRTVANSFDDDSKSDAGREPAPAL